MKGVLLTTVALVAVASTSCKKKAPAGDTQEVAAAAPAPKPEKPCPDGYFEKPGIFCIQIPNGFKALGEPAFHKTFKYWSMRWTREGAQGLMAPVFTVIWQDPSGYARIRKGMASEEANQAYHQVVEKGTLAGEPAHFLWTRNPKGKPQFVTAVLKSTQYVVSCRSTVFTTGTPAEILRACKSLRAPR